jgi:uncharacterized phage protein (TIGR01671 family)
MRTIKFRGQSRYTTHEWLYGSYLVLGDKHYILPIDDKMLCNYEVIPETVCQFTGLSDKNGVEIYEGDILLDVEFDENGNDISGKFQVVYDSSKCQFSIDNSFKKDGSSLVNFVEYFGIENLEVVGNIHDNPEMLFSF